MTDIERVSTTYRNVRDDAPGAAQQRPEVPFGYFAVAFHPVYFGEADSGLHQGIRMSAAFSLPVGRALAVDAPQDEGRKWVDFTARSAGEATWDLSANGGTITQAGNTVHAAASDALSLVQLAIGADANDRLAHYRETRRFVGDESVGYPCYGDELPQKKVKKVRQLLTPHAEEMKRKRKEDRAAAIARRQSRQRTARQPTGLGAEQQPIPGTAAAGAAEGLVLL